MKSPFIFSGTFAKSLVSSINLKNTAYIIQGTTDPTLVAANAPAGFLYMRTGGSPGMYMKNDAGSTTNWSLLQTTTALNAVHEIPVGIVTGVNAVFTLSATPLNLASLVMYIDGIEVLPANYSIVGTAVTFLAAAIPVLGQTVTAYYLVAGTAVPSGIHELTPDVVDGVNDDFNLSQIPVSLNALVMFIDGIEVLPANYSLLGTVVTFVPAAIPVVGQTVTAFYLINGAAAVAWEAEVPAGAIPGAAFTLSFAPVDSKTLSLYVDGLFLIPVTNYTRVGTAITLVTPLVGGQEIYATYRKT